jgi:hypothetical protein
MKTTACGPECYATPECKVCGQRKRPRGRSVPTEAENSYCGHDCPGYNEDPQPGHFWPSESDDTGPCEGALNPCENQNGRRAPVMTDYAWDGEGEDPNKPPILCPSCTDGWVDAWEERWSDYYR